MACQTEPRRTGSDGRRIADIETAFRGHVEIKRPHVENQSWLSAGGIDILQRVLKREGKIAGGTERIGVRTVDRADQTVTLEYIPDLGHGGFAEIVGLDTQVHRTVRVKYDAAHIDRCRQRGSAPGTERQRTSEHGSSALLVHDFLL